MGDRDSLNTKAHRITGKIHHHTLASARALLREGLNEEEVLERLRRRGAPAGQPGNARSATSRGM